VIKKGTLIWALVLHLTEDVHKGGQKWQCQSSTSADRERFKVGCFCESGKGRPHV